MKSALAGPIGAAADKPIDQVKRGLRHSAASALQASNALLDQARADIGAAAVHGTAGSAAIVSAPPPSAAPSPSKSTSPAAPADPSLPSRMEGRFSRALVRKILREAAVRHGLDPRMVLALSFWESGWDQSRVSETGAVGLMQVEPDVGEQAGPSLVGRTVDITDPYDNADVGAAIFREDLDNFGNPEMALAAYYQGPDSVRQNGMFPDTQQYVQGILELATRMTD